MKRIVVVEDEVFMREELENLLQKAGYEVRAVDSFEHVAKNLLEMSPNLILLDLNLPNLSGFQICREVKQKSPIPVVILTSRDQMRDELHALEIGADEYLTKPCRKERLLARIANVLKRYEGRANLLEGEGFLLDRQTYTLYIHDASVVLPKNQGKLLEVFLLGGQKVVTKEDLCDALWGTSEFIDENALQVNLTRLKKTMTNLQMHQKIVPVRGEGYRLMMEDGTDEA
jgi:DNA-binding response OmpR family regulator